MLRFQLLRFFIALALVISGCTSAPIQTTPEQRKEANPQRLVLMVFDGLNPDTIERFHLNHFKTLAARSQNYTHAYLGYIASGSPVSHMVIPAGKPPKELPIQDEVFYDLEGRLGDRGQFYITRDLTTDQLQTLETDIDEEVQLPYQFKERFGGKVYAVGEQRYAAVELGTSTADSIIALKNERGRCIPDGINVPHYIASNAHFQRDCSKPRDQDAWVADVGLEIVKQGDWKALLMTFSGISQGAQESESEFEKRAKRADEQLGRIWDAFEAQGLWKETLIVVTSGHGTQINRQKVGKIAHNDNIQFFFRDTAVRVWLKDRASNPDSVLQDLSRVSGVTEIYALQRDGNNWLYQKAYSALQNQSKEFVGWAAIHSKEIVDASATVNSPDFVALLSDQTGWDGSTHGGAQEAVQRIPLIIYNPKLSPHENVHPLRAYEIKGEIFRQFSR